MTAFRYAGQDPVPDGEGGVVRPGEIREFGAEPGWGPWEAVDEPEPPADVPPAPAPARSTASKTEPASDDSATE